MCLVFPQNAQEKKLNLREQNDSVIKGLKINSGFAHITTCAAETK